VSTNFCIIIPARYGSSRLPGKPLLLIKDKPLVQHVFETASSTQAKKIIIATDNDEIINTVTSFGGTAILTSSKHQSGTDRIAEVVEKLNFDDEEIIINLQGDEFGLSAPLIDQLASNLSKNTDCDVATLCERIISMEEYTDQNIVKVVFDANNKAIFFSRSPIPANRSGGLPGEVYRHIGLYAYRARYLKKFTQLERCELEKTEQLEQLRILYNGGRIHLAVVVSSKGIGIDTNEDLKIARSGENNQ
jgi:3-deoxy-manno-octulosonate cytidylyltransferase (CMP-KDO synthetase)